MTIRSRSRCYGDGTGNPRPSRGWAAALTTSSTYELMFPGLVKKSPTTASVRSLNRGVIQKDLTVDANEVRYGWVLQQGLGVIVQDVNGESIAHGDFYLCQ